MGLNKYKLVISTVTVGLFINAILDVPFMYLFAKLKLPAYYGAITASLTGVCVSNIISMIYLKKKMHLNHKETITTIPRFILSTIVLILSLNIFNQK